ncbi:MAG: MFS transporter, partial [Actinobacteria bacterium]|nr:MFS transporter [Actinomycetota bacterium]
GRGWSDALVIVGFVVAALGLAGFVLYEHRAANPLLDLQYFRAPRFAMGSLGITFSFLAMFSMFFVLTQYLQYVRGASPLGAGVRTLPFALTMIVVSPRSADLAHRFGVRRVVAVGMSTVVVGLLMFSFAGIHTGYWYIALVLVIMALGVGMTMPSLSTGIVQSVPMHKAGVGSAVNDTTREVGGAVGIALVGSIVTSVYRHRLGPSLDALPPELADVARDNVGKAVEVTKVATQQMGDDVGSDLLEAVRQAFVDGAHVGLRVSASLVVLAGIVIYVRLGRDDASRIPGRGGDARDS